MDRKLSRIEILDNCSKCKHVSKNGLATVCGLSKKTPGYDFFCSDFLSKDFVAPKKKTFFDSWVFALVMSVLALIRFILKSDVHHFDILSIVLFLLGIGWLLVAIFHRKLK